ncbi:aKG-HExxH-type peptide beta-hydroxylase [Cupriavidus sp. TMH.W2]|uniref:aKG-HExxH-type peptide beta-hydroxylase n=1 Tax=Cupriavidus sp. TMH.W2 TaxID=3434465 RepID=UPI003D7793F8
MIEDAHRLASALIFISPSISRESMISPYKKGMTSSVWDIYDYYIDCDEKLRLILKIPDEKHVIEVGERLTQMNEILPEADLALFQELGHLVVQIVVFDDKGSSDMGAESASSFALWGSVLVNMRRSVHELYFLEALLHESAHLLLFALCQDDPVVTNSRDERFVSPLRSDLRTMDGLFHAAYVTARMHYGLSKLKECKSIGVGLAGLIDERCAVRQKQFQDATDVIRRYGKLTGHGRDIINSALSCMGEPLIGELAAA